MLQRSPVPAHRPRVALKPFSAANNSFSGLFSAALDAERLEPVPFAWEDLGTGRNAVVLFHWPTEFFRPESRKAVLRLIARMARDRLRHGTRFVWVVHNLQPHDGPGRPSRLTTRLFLRLLDGLIFLSEDSRDALGRLHPEARAKPSLVTVHGRYADHAAPPRPFEGQAEGGAHRLLFFGLVRDYKNVERLVAEARRVTRAPFALTVLGACPDPALAARIRAAAGSDERIRLDLREAPVPDAELEAAIDAHDAVVLPYRRILNSGVALHALGRNRPILAPATGSLPELRERVGADWVHLFEGEIDSGRIEAFLGELSKMSAPEPDLSAFSWTHVGAAVSDFLLRLAPEQKRSHA